MILPKYINVKGSVKTSPFGIERIDPTKPVYVVEGYFDAIQLRQAGFNVVATGQAAITREQAQALKNAGVNGVVLNFDNDKAGIKATENGMT
jgi:DNA primase